MELWATPTQAFTSAKTSIKMPVNKLPRVIRVGTFKPYTVNADIGGGRWDFVSQHLESLWVTNVIYDPFNRSKEWNDFAVEFIKDGNADTVTVSNVLNVIAEPIERQRVIAQACNAVKPDGAVYFGIYEGDKSGVGKATRAGWQENRVTRDYEEEISLYFDSVTFQKGVIIAYLPKKDLV